MKKLGGIGTMVSRPSWARVPRSAGAVVTSLVIRGSLRHWHAQRLAKNVNPLSSSVHISKTTQPHVDCGRGSVVLWLVAKYTSGFVDDITATYSRAARRKEYATTAETTASIPDKFRQTLVTAWYSCVQFRWDEVR